jgi:ankyrin repeat protein
MDQWIDRSMDRFIVLVAIVSALGSGCAAFYQRPPSELSDAAWRGDMETVRQLVKNGADINELNGAPLFMAARGGHPLGPHTCGVEAADRAAEIAALLELGANPNQRDGRPRTVGGSSGWTSLFVALHHKQFKSAIVLLNHGADPTLKSDQGMTVMEMAEVEGAPKEVMDLIRTKAR